jgi:hypothetical protein
MTFAGLWTEADCAGRGVANAKVLCGRIWPHDDDITPDVVNEHLEALSKEHIVLYSIGDKRYYMVLNWEFHQAESYRRGNPKHPEPPPEILHDLNVKNPAPRGIEGKGREGKGIEGNRSVSRKSAETSIPDDFTITPALKEWASMSGFDWLNLNNETQKFLEHHGAKGSTFKSWNLAWQKWIRQAAEWQADKKPKQRQGFVQPRTFEAKQLTYCEECHDYHEPDEPHVDEPSELVRLPGE